VITVLDRPAPQRPLVPAPVVLCSLNCDFKEALYPLILPSCGEVPRLKKGISLSFSFFWGALLFTFRSVVFFFFFPHFLLFCRFLLLMLVLLTYYRVINPCVLYFFFLLTGLPPWFLFRMISIPFFLSCSLEGGPWALWIFDLRFRLSILYVIWGSFLFVHFNFYHFWGPCLATLNFSTRITKPHTFVLASLEKSFFLPYLFLVGPGGLLYIFSPLSPLQWSLPSHQMRSVYLAYFCRLSPHVCFIPVVKLLLSNSWKFSSSPPVFPFFWAFVVTLLAVTTALC